MLRLLELKLINHPILKDLSIDFTEKNDAAHSLYYSVLIGQNGTGKSYILQAIISIFREAGHFINTNKSRRSGAMKGSFYLKYRLNKDEVEIANMTFFKGFISPVRVITNDDSKTSLFFNVNGMPSTDGRYIPNKVLASTMIFSDKFPAVKDLALWQYHYLGLRSISSPTTAGTRAIGVKLASSLTENLGKQGFIFSLNKILSDLKYVPSITISYSPKYANQFYNQNLEVESFQSMFRNWKETFKSRKSEPWGLRYFQKIENESELLKQLVRFLNKIHLKDIGRGGKYFSYDIMNENNSLDDFAMINHLHKLDLVSFPSIHLHKEGNSFGFTNSSSGEQNIVFSLLTILGNIENNSVVLIDEPELSLHPNWQMQYFSILNEVFKNYSGIHFIVATHSHFLISDLKGENSKIIGLKRNEKIETMDMPKNIDTYGWSAEDVLYRVFGVRTTRNYFMGVELRELLHMISSKSNEKETMQQIINRLDKVKLNEGDPLNLILEKAKTYIEKI